MGTLVPVDVYVDGAVLNTVNYNKGCYSATAEEGRYSVLNGKIEAANMDGGFSAPPRLLQPLQGVQGFNASGRSPQSFYNDYNAAPADDTLFSVHGITLEFDVAYTCDFALWQMGFFLSHWRAFVVNDQEEPRGPVQDLRYRLSLDGSPLAWTTRGLGCTARIDQTATSNDLTILERVHQRYAHISHMQTPVAPGRHYLELRVYMALETVNDTTNMKIADNSYDVEVDYYSRLTFGMRNVCAVTM